MITEHSVDYKVHMSHCNMGDYEGNCKYCEDDCPALSPSPELWLFMRKGLAHGKAKELYEQGYICISNKYKTIARVDRPDWVDVVNKKWGKNITTDNSQQWVDFYCRVHSTDTRSVCSYEYNALKKIRQDPALR